tara:strand:+ start:10932 stop:11402 length:471 start_codon:yes stop_codon:yes gene_type:complete
MVKKITQDDYIYVNNYLLNCLLTDHNKYYEKLEYFKNIYGLEFISKIINWSSYETYCGNHLHALVMITGKLINDTQENIEKKIWGINTSVDDLLSSKICERLFEYGINYNSVNYYEETPYQCCIQNNSFTSRYNNKLLKTTLRKQLIHDLNKNFDF